MKRLIAMMAGLMMLCCAFAAGEGITVRKIDMIPMPVPDNEALRMIREMKAGWNLGNTFDAHSCFWVKDPLDYETAWCGAKTTEALIDALKAAGFRTLRVPVSWHDHLSEDWTIDPAWMDRVHEVVTWAYDRGMYVIINIHHDDDVKYYYPDAAHFENSAKYIRTIWAQVAKKFGHFDHHVIFESINEPRLKDTANEWWWDESNAACQEAMAQIVKLNQVFVDTVRATGGKNADRYLMVPAYDANPYYACSDAFALPEDTAENRIIVSAHAYTPYNFALEMPGISTFTLEGNQKEEITDFLFRLYSKYVRKGIPVLMGEFGAMEKQGNLQARADWLAYYVATARAHGITCCWWDNNLFQGDGERFGFFDRATAECVNPELLQAFMDNCE